MKNFLFTLLTTLALIGSQSCGKDTDEFIPVTTKIDTIQTARKETDWQEDLWTITNVPTSVLPLLTIEKLMADFATDPSIHNLSAERGGTIQIQDNVSVEFLPNSCVTQNNTPCTGTLKVEALVLRKKGDFLLNNMPTVSNNKQLISGSQVLIKVRQNGVEVKLANNKSYKVKYTAAEDDMKLFEGKFEGRFKFDWKSIVNSSNGTAPSIKPWSETIQGRRTGGYELLLDSFKWYSSAKLISNSTTANSTNKFCVALTDSLFTNQNCNVFAVFKDINSVIALRGNGTTKQFCLPSGYEGLTGKVTIIAIGMVKNKIHIGEKEATIPTNPVIRVELKGKTKPEVKEIMDDL